MYCPCSPCTTGAVYSFTLTCSSLNQNSPGRGPSALTHPSPIVASSCSQLSAVSPINNEESKFSNWPLFCTRSCLVLNLRSDASSGDSIALQNCIHSFSRNKPRNTHPSLHSYKRYVASGPSNVSPKSGRSGLSSYQMKSSELAYAFAPIMSTSISCPIPVFCLWYRPIEAAVVMTAVVLGSGFTSFALES